MATKKKAKQTAEDVKAYTMQLSVNAPIDVYAAMSLEELEKQYNLASARTCYASQQLGHWREEQYKRDKEFIRITTAYRQRKGGFTDEQVQGNPPTSSAMWTYAK